MGDCSYEINLGIYTKNTWFVYSKILLPPHKTLDNCPCLCYNISTDLYGFCESVRLVAIYVEIEGYFYVLPRSGKAFFLRKRRI